MSFLSFFFSTAIGVRCKDGVVFAVEKLVTSKLYESGSNTRIFNIDTHIGMVKSIYILNMFLGRVLLILYFEQYHLNFSG